MERVLAVLALLLAGCISESKVVGPNGQPAYLVSCPGWLYTVGDCYLRAGEICGSAGFDLIAGSYPGGTRMADADPYKDYGDYVGSADHQAMLIACRSDREMVVPTAPSADSKAEPPPRIGP